MRMYCVTALYLELINWGKLRKKKERIWGTLNEISQLHFMKCRDKTCDLIKWKKKKLSSSQ